MGALLTTFALWVRMIPIRVIGGAMFGSELSPSLSGMQPQPQPSPAPVLDSAELLGARDEVLIVHGGETYRLRRTRQGKLILTK